MRIAHVTSSLAEPLGGAEQYCVELAAWQAARGHAVSISGPVPSPELVARLAARGVTVRDLARWRPYPPGVAGRRLAKVLFHGLDAIDSVRLPAPIARHVHGADVVHVHRWQGLGAAVLAVPGIVTAHTVHDFALVDTTARTIRRGTAPDRLPLPQRVRTRILNRAVSGLDVTIFPTRRTRDRHAALGHRPARPVVIPHGWSLPVAASAGRRSDGPLTVTFMGKLTVEKGVGTVLEAWGDGVPGARLVVAGAGDLQPLVEDRAATGALEFRGWLDKEAQAALLAETDLLVLASHWPENFPLVVAEALLAGVPVLATEANAPEMLAHDANAIIVPPGASALRAAIESLVADPERIGRLRAGARQSAIALDMDAHGEAVLEQYRLAGTQDPDRTPRVLMATDVIGPGGGPAGYTFNLLQGFAERSVTDGYTIRGEREAESKRYRGTGEKVQEGRALTAVRAVLERLPHQSLHRALSTARWLTSGRDRAHRVAYRDAEVVVFQGYQPSIRARWAHRRRKVVVYMPHSPNPVADEMRILETARGERSPEPRFRFLRRDEERMIARADFVAMASPGAAEQYRLTFPRTMAASTVRYVSSGVARPAPATTVGTAGGAPVVLFAGRYVSHKGYDLFLAAAEIAAGRGLDGRFQTLGTGPDAHESPAVDDLGWSEDPASHLRDAAVVVVPNRIAYFDLLPLEAAALGKPMVLTRVGGSADQLLALPDTIGCEPDADSLASAIAEALRRIAADPGYGSRNETAYAERFTPLRLADHWDTVLLEAVRLMPGSRRRAR